MLGITPAQLGAAHAQPCRLLPAYAYGLAPSPVFLALSSA
ncbi:hypothetical protein THIX_30086 [Thiomonas sp. X19]|nr:hypothetical protein THIX_30086 [Thiomonas sp. X19]